MKITTEYIYNSLGLPVTADKAKADIDFRGRPHKGGTPIETGNVAKALKKTADKAVEFAEAPFKSRVVVYETAEDHLDN